MKKLTLFFAIAMIALTSKTFAQVTQQEATDVATSTATVITPISLTNVSGINFGTIAATIAGTVVISSAGTYTTTGGVTVTADSTPAPATFTVDGEDGYAYTTVLPLEDISLSDGAETTPNTMILNSITSNATGTIVTAGETFNVGGTLNVTTDQAAGIYTNEADLAVTVYYN